MRRHQAPRPDLPVTAQAHQLGMDEVERSDIERRRHGDPAAAFDQPLDKVETGLAMIEAAIDMRTDDRQQGFRANRIAEGDQHLHCH